MSEHTIKAFDTELHEIVRKIAEMGGLAEKQIADSVDALAKRDADRARRVVGTDPAIDVLQSVSRLIGEIITPEVRDAGTRLRTALAAYRAQGLVLERRIPLDPDVFALDRLGATGK